MNRREFIRRLVVSSVLVATAASGALELASLASKNGQQLSNVINQQSTTTTLQTAAGSSSTQVTSSSQAPSGYVFITAESQLSSKSYAYFSHPSYGSSILVKVSGQWKAFSAICTHRPCTVDYQSSEIYCPCHGGTFSPSDGSVTGGPPPSPLPEFGVQILNANVYVSSARVN